MTIYQFYQPPLYWQQFEDLAVQLLAEVHDIPNAQALGRPGQAQNGVDVFGRSRKYGLIAVQCKRLSDLDKNGNPYPGGVISRKFLFDAAEEIKDFPQKVSLWILATTAKRDTAVQLHVEDLNEKWRNEGHSCTAMVWSWDDCVTYLNSFPNLQKRYYRDVIQVNSTRDLDLMIIETIAMAFHRRAFEAPLHIETPRDFLQALEDTQRAMRTGELLDRISRHVIRKSIGGWRRIEDRDWKSRLEEIDLDLRALRTGVGLGLKDGAIGIKNDFLDFSKNMDKARRLEELRDSCIQKLNAILSETDITPI
ncbi:hypothetical protein [Mesorhizobium sp. M0013]|uniref:hypothetical protein n=1 Tax=Mesorhizobium sp. M0013 TaxID=2956841 RepID=UPI003339A544